MNRPFDVIDMNMGDANQAVSKSAETSAKKPVRSEALEESKCPSPAEVSDVCSLAEGTFESDSEILSAKFDKLGGSTLSTEVIEAKYKLLYPKKSDAERYLVGPYFHHRP